MAKKKEPGKINIVVILVVAALGAAIWAGIRYAPGIMTQRNVEKTLRLAATQMYQQRNQKMDKPGIEKKLREELKGMGIDNPKIELVQDADWMTARVRYTESLSMPAATQEVVVEGRVSAKVGSY